MSGFTKSYRQKWHHPVFRDLLEAGIWAWMCDTAAWKDTSVRFNGEVIKLSRGQLVTSVRFISQGFRIGEQVTRTFMQNLEKDAMANTLTTHRGTIITICNYDKFQQNENTDNTPLNTQLTNCQQTANTNKKERKKERIEPPTPKGDFAAFYSLFPKKVSPKDAERAYKKALKTVSHETIMTGVLKYKSSVAHMDRQYIQAPAAWLNKGRWADEYTSGSHDIPDWIKAQR